MLRITDAQWELIRKHFPEEHYPDDRPGRKPIPARKVLEAVLWILNTGARWHMLPQSYPNYKTVHRRFQQWCENEVIRAALRDLANALRARGELDESECYIDATFASAKGGGEQIGPTRRAKGVKIMAIVDRHGLPLAVTTRAANHHEVTLVQLTFDFYMIEAKPENLIGDRAYDSDPLDQQLRLQGVEMIAPHKSNRVTRKTQDGRRLRRYERRWIVERFFAWIQWQRRLLVRFDLRPDIGWGLDYRLSALGRAHGRTQSALRVLPAAGSSFIVTSRPSRVVETLERGVSQYNALGQRWLIELGAYRTRAALCAQAATSCPHAAARKKKHPPAVISDARAPL